MPFGCGVADLPSFFSAQQLALTILLSGFCLYVVDLTICEQDVNICYLGSLL